VRRKKRKDRSNAAAYQVVSSQNGTDILGIGVCLVVEDGVEEQNRTHGEEGGSNHWNDPVDGLPA